VSAAGGVSRAVERAVERHCDCMQIFSSSPRVWKHSWHAPEEIRAFRDGVRRHRISPVVVHGSYLLNLASNRRGLWRRSVRLLSETLRWSCALGAEFVVFHAGHFPEGDLAGGLNRVAKALRQVSGRRREGIALAMEMTAGGGNSVGGNLGHFKAILDRVGWNPRVMIWMDTAHAFAAGFDFREAEGVSRLAREIDSAVGLERLAGVHLNDSRSPLGSRLDRHENLGAGLIGKRGIRLVLRNKAFRKIPFILETPGFDLKGPDLRNMNIAMRLAR